LQGCFRGERRSSAGADVLNTNIDRAIAIIDTWAADEDRKLRNTVQTHGGKNCGAIAALVPGQTKSRCIGRWKDVLDPSIDRANESTGKWSADGDVKLKDAVQTHGGKNWGPIAIENENITFQIRVR
jgi:hypothetical protein